MKKWKYGLLMLLILCTLSMVPAGATEATGAIEAQTEAQTEIQTEAQAEEDERSSGNYNSKKTFGIDKELDGLAGDAKYLGSAYRQNYHLDLEKTGISDLADAAANGLANGLFSALQMFSMLVCSMVYFCLEFSLADTIAKFITELQRGLIGGVYKELWLFAIAIMGASIIGKLFKKELAEVFKDFIMVIFVTILSIMLMTHSDTVLTASTNITKSASNAIFTGLDNATGVTNGDSYARVAAGSLWADMIHVPWLSLEFGSVDVSEEVVETILSLEPGSADRKDVVKDMTKETGCFGKSRAWGRLGMLLCYSIPALLKGVTFIAIGLLQFLGQFLALFILLLAFVVLILAIVPHYGPSILQLWLGKFTDIHLSMIILSFLMAFLIWINKVVYGLSGDLGWLICLVIQAVACILLFLNYRTILFMLLNPRNGMSEMNRMIRRLNRQGGYPGGGGGFRPFRPRSRGRGRSTHDEYEEDFYDEDYEEYDAYEQDYDQGEYHGSGAGSDREDYYDRQAREYSQFMGQNDAQPRYANGEADYQNADLSRNDIDDIPNTPDMPESQPDYAAIRNAPTQQELYHLFDDEPSNETVSNVDIDTAAQEDYESWPREELGVGGNTSHDTVMDMASDSIVDGTDNSVIYNNEADIGGVESAEGQVLRAQEELNLEANQSPHPELEERVITNATEIVEKQERHSARDIQEVKEASQKLEEAMLPDELQGLEAYQDDISMDELAEARDEQEYME